MAGFQWPHTLKDRKLVPVIKPLSVREVFLTVFGIYLYKHQWDCCDIVSPCTFSYLAALVHLVCDTIKKYFRNVVRKAENNYFRMPIAVPQSERI